MQNFTSYPDANIKKILTESLNAIYCLLNLYIDIGTRSITKMKTCSIHHWNQNRNTAENKCISLQYLFICLFIFDYMALFLRVKDMTCLRIKIPAYSCNIFGSIFGVLLCLLIKKFVRK